MTTSMLVAPGIVKSEEQVRAEAERKRRCVVLFNMIFSPFIDAVQRRRICDDYVAGRIVLEQHGSIVGDRTSPTRKAELDSALRESNYGEPITFGYVPHTAHIELFRVGRAR